MKYLPPQQLKVMVWLFISFNLLMIFFLIYIDPPPKPTLILVETKENSALLKWNKDSVDDDISRKNFFLQIHSKQFMIDFVF